jgi:hypothetical protein
MKPPIIVDAKGDLLVFDSVETMLTYLEAIDVRNQEYTAYDSEGRLLQLGVAKTRVFFGLLEGHEVVSLESEEATPSHASELRACVSDFLIRVGVDRAWVAQASQSQLVEKALRPDGVPMPDLPFLNGYSGETADHLISLEGKYRVDSLVLAFEQAMDQKATRVGYDKLSEEESTVLAIEALEREVNNGGYEQFFVNSSRRFAPIIVPSLLRIGCPRTAEITRTALNAVQQAPIAPDLVNRTPAEEERDDILSECDSLYFEHPENIEESLFAFIKVNRDHIKPTAG